MATTTYQNLRRGFAQFLGYGHIIGKDGGAWSTTVDIAASALLISTELQDSGFDDYGAAGSGDDRLEQHWVYLLGSNNSQVSRVIKLQDASAGELTVTGTNLSAESGSTDFEVHRFQPSILKGALNDARVLAFPLLHLPVHRTLFTSRHLNSYEVPSAIVERPTAIFLERGIYASHVNNILSNADFEDWTSGAPDNWTATNLDTAEEVSTTDVVNYVVLDTGSSARLTSQGSSTGTLLQTISSPGTHSGQRISLSIWVYCLTPNAVSTQITINGSINLGAAGDGGLHGGTGWELLTHFEDAQVTITSLTVGVSILSTATDNTEFYGDRWICVIGPIQEPTDTGQELQNWEYRPLAEGSTARNRVVFPYDFPDNYLLRFEGMNYLSSVSAESDTMEIGDPQTELLFAYAAERLWSRLPRRVDSDNEYLRLQTQDAERNINKYRYLGMPTIRHRLQNPSWSP